ncbi:MAG: hypothetical protein K2N51_17050 [Lachnospiraceae bacterium]|nr:hypothetical protein [Lachnospiraceae bacterium]
MEISLAHLHDDRLSDKAKMLFTVILSLNTSEELIKETWDILMASDDKKHITEPIKELHKYGYITEDLDVVEQPTQGEED